MSIGLVTSPAPLLHRLRWARPPSEQYISSIAARPHPSSLPVGDPGILAISVTHDGLLIPAATLADNCHGVEFRFRTRGRRSRPRDMGSQRREQVADQHVHPGAEVVEIGYHPSHLG